MLYLHTYSRLRYVIRSNVIMNRGGSRGSCRCQWKLVPLCVVPVFISIRRLFQPGSIFARKALYGRLPKGALLVRKGVFVTRDGALLRK